MIVENHPGVLLDKNSLNHFPLHLALVNKQPLTVKFLIEKMGLEALTEVTTKGSTPLKYACQIKNSPEVAKYLLETEPAASTIRDSYGWDAFLSACKYHLPDLVELMIEKQPGILEQKYFEPLLSPLYVAAVQNFPLENVRVLVECRPEALKGRKEPVWHYSTSSFDQSEKAW
jgi:ankyrin repeat protein